MDGVIGHSPKTYLAKLYALVESANLIVKEIVIHPQDWRIYLAACKPDEALELNSEFNLWGAQVILQLNTDGIILNSNNDQFWIKTPMLSNLFFKPQADA